MITPNIQPKAEAPDQTPDDHRRRRIPSADLLVKDQTEEVRRKPWPPIGSPAKISL